MARTLATLRSGVLTRLNDAAEAIWTGDEIDGYLETAYQLIAQQCRVFWDMIYAENLPAHFSYTQAWELAVIQQTAGLYDWGQANYTIDDERRLLVEVPADELARVGPAWFTSPADLPFLDAAGANTSIPATAVLPETVQQIDRGIYDRRAISALPPRTIGKYDARYLSTEGAVDAYAWELDGLHTIRKWRKPATIAAYVTVNGSWGICRDVGDVASESDVDGSWGIPRCVSGIHPMGPESFGLPRRFYRDGTNVRLEVYRHGREMDGEAPCELPDRYADGLMFAALSDALTRPGAGQDVKLGSYYQARWTRIIARLTRRTATMQKEQTYQMGGTARSSVQSHARPRLPWPYPAIGMR